MFKLSIKTGGAAFDPFPEYEIARLLREVAKRVEAGSYPHKIIDANGNTVGKVEVTK